MFYLHKLCSHSDAYSDVQPVLDMSCDVKLSRYEPFITSTSVKEWNDFGEQCGHLGSDTRFHDECENFLGSLMNENTLQDLSYEDEQLFLV